MAEAEQPNLSTARSYPDRVPLLVDHPTGVLLRPTQDSDLPAMVELARDPDSIRWTTVPTPEGGYQRSDAAAFVMVEAEGWRTGRRLGWAIETERDGTRAFCGHVSLHLEGAGLAEIDFALHPAARGRSIMSTAVRLVRDYGFDVAGLETIQWRSMVGNWASRRIASAAGFVFDGTVRRLLVQRGERARRLGGHHHPRRSAPAAVVADPGRAVPVRWSDCALSAPEMCSGSSRPARTSAPSTGSSRCPGRTGSRTRSPTLRPSRNWRRPAVVWCGAWPIPRTTAAWARSASRDSVPTPSGPRSAIGPTRRPVAAA